MKQLHAEGKCVQSTTLETGRGHEGEAWRVPAFQGLMIQEGGHVHKSFCSPAAQNAATEEHHSSVGVEGQIENLHRSYPKYMNFIASFHDA